MQQSQAAANPRHQEVYVRFLLVFDGLLILFRIAWWTSCGKDLTSWLSACADLFLAVLIFCSIPVWCLGKKWNSIVSVPDHCLFICLRLHNTLLIVLSALRLTAMSVISLY